MEARKPVSRSMTGCEAPKLESTRQVSACKNCLSLDCYLDNEVGR